MRRITKRTGHLIVLILALFAILTFSCGKNETGPQTQPKIIIVTTLFPLYDFARSIAAEKAEVVLLLSPGVEAHAFEPKPGDMLKIDRARLFIYTGKYMEPWAESIIRGSENKKLTVVDTSRGITLMRTGNEAHADNKEDVHNDKHQDHGAYDPHIWLDPENAMKMVDNIVDGLSAADPSNKDLYLKNAGRYKEKLAALDSKFREGLGTCKKKVIIHGGHFAFGYLARRYGLEYVSAYEGSPNAEPTAVKIIMLKKKIKDNDVKFVFFEELITPRVSELLSRETGATLLKLHGIHNISKEEMEKGTGFIPLMEENLANLKVGLECR